MEDSTKKKIHEIEITAAVILILVSVISFFPKPGITGHVSAEIKTKTLNLTIANSQSYFLKAEKQEPFYLTSLKLSGEVIGSGIVKAYISDGKGQKILIYSNAAERKKGIRPITGMGKITGGVVSEGSAAEADDIIIDYLENLNGGPGKLSENEESSSGNFENICIESCFIEMLLNKELSYQLLFYVEEGTILKINKVAYTVKKDQNG